MYDRRMTSTIQKHGFDIVFVQACMLERTVQDPVPLPLDPLTVTLSELDATDEGKAEIFQRYFLHEYLSYFISKRLGPTR